MPDMFSMLNNIQQGEQRANGLKALNLTWKRKVGTIQEAIGSGDYIRGQSFYTSTYKCPKCGAFLYKSRASIGFDTTEKKYVSARSVFACFDCQNLFASDYTARLGSGEYYTMDDTSKFYPAVQVIDTTATSVSQLMGF